MTATITSVSQTLKDFYPRPGERIKQYVVDTRREMDWVARTCPRVHVDEHEHYDDGEFYAFEGDVAWVDLGRYSCDMCEALYHDLVSRPDIAAWLAEKAARPPIEPDRTKLSDEIAPEWPAMRENPLLAMVRRKS